MKKVTSERLAALQTNPENIRNICILAHVDHGKTTLADSLIASNGIISQRMAGKLRYMDSREDEQQRGITMKSNAISLYFERQGVAEKLDEYLINLIDSPGHIDFSSEVSTAVRLCDGAIVLVDVVEGVCPQTHAVLRQAWLENIKPVLVFNKLDRLIVELKMSPLEAHVHLLQLLEQVNAITGALFTRGVLAKSMQNSEDAKSLSPVADNAIYDWSTGLDDIDDSLLYFAPGQGNVIFASAIDGWGFKIDQFAELFSRKVGVSAAVLNKTLWGDFYLDAKTKSVRKGAQKKNKKPLFVQFVLENLWTFYDAVVIKPDKERVEKIIKSLDLKPVSKTNDPKTQLKCLLNQWLPLSRAVLEMICDQLPSPVMMSEERAEKLLCSSGRRFSSLPLATQSLKNDFLACKSSDAAPVIVFVSKMFSVETKDLPQNKPRQLSAEELGLRREEVLAKRNMQQRNVQTPATIEQHSDAAVNNSSTNEGACSERDSRSVSTSLSNALNTDANQSGNGKPEPEETFIAFARVFSGTLRRGQTLYVLGPKYDPNHALDTVIDSDKNRSKQPDEFSESATRYMAKYIVEDLYMLMGRELTALETVPAGNILGIGGLSEYIQKSATLSSTIACPPFTDMYQEAAAIVRVAVEPKNIGDIKKLVSGMKLLNQSDPCVEILVQESGEHVIIAAGEVHLQKCLDDLRDRFAKIPINVSAPTVPFRETIVRPPTIDRVNESIQDQPATSLLKVSWKPSDIHGDEARVSEVFTANRQCSVRVVALPLPAIVTKLLDANTRLIKTFQQFVTAKFTNQSLDEVPVRINEETERSLTECKVKLEEAFKLDENGEIWAGVVDRIWSFGPKRSCTNILVNGISDYDRPSIWSCLCKDSVIKGQLRVYDSSVIGGFQIATQAGPLCEEPMAGVCFIVLSWEMNLYQLLENTASDDKNIELNETKSGDDSVSIAHQLSNLVLRDADLNCSEESTVTTSLCKDVSKQSTTGQFTGQLISCVKDACRRAFQCHPQRLVWAMYTCVVLTTADGLGKLYGVLGKRNGRVLEEDMRDGWSMFAITAVLPVVESFGFADEVRKKTSGLASPQLQFSHWEVIDIDPFWVPTTEEEYLHFGEKADSENIAQKHMNAIRRRKGLKVNEKIVEFAEKQRTLKKNK